MANLQELLEAKRLDEINALLVDPKNETATGLRNRALWRAAGGTGKVAEAVKLENLMARLEKAKSYV